MLDLLICFGTTQINSLSNTLTIVSDTLKDYTYYAPIDIGFLKLGPLSDMSILKPLDDIMIQHVPLLLPSPSLIFHLNIDSFLYHYVFDS